MGAGFGADAIANALAGKPVIPAWQDITLGDQQSKAISNNQAALPALENLSSQYNNFTADQMTKLLGQVIPDFQGISTGVSSKIDSFLKGEIPGDVSNAVQDSAAARALTGGFGGSGLSGNLTARDLGLTSLNLIDKGISTAQSWIGQMSNILSPRLFNASSMFVSPQQQFEDTFQNQEAQFQRQYASNLNDWQHSFGYAAGQDVQDTVSTVVSIAAGMLGGSTAGKQKTPDNNTPTFSGSLGAGQGAQMGADMGSFDSSGLGAGTGASFGALGGVG